MHDSEGQSLLSSTLYRGSFKRIALVGFLVWNVLLFILVVVALSKKNTIVHNDTYPTYRSSIVSQFAATQDVQQGMVVSADVNGNLMVGAGLSIYLNSSILDAQEPLNHLVVTSVSSSMIVAAFKTGNVVKAAVGFVDGTQVNWAMMKSLSLTNVDSIVALSPELVVVTGTPYFLPISVFADGTMNPGNAYIFAHGTSIDPQTAALSYNGFAISYYQLVGNSYALLTVMCEVALSLEVAMTPPIVYSGDQVSHGILPLNSTSYLVVYPDLLNSAPSPSSPSGAPLVAQLVTLLSNFTLSLPPVSATLNDSLANYFFATARLSPTLGAVLFVDTSRNNALVTATIEYDPENDALVFGSALAINRGDASGVTTSGLWMFIDLIPLALPDTPASSTQRFVAAYSDLANAGRVVATVCEISPNEEIVLASATFVLSAPDPDMDYYWVASTAVSDSQFLVMDALSGPTGVTGGKIAFGEMKPNPIGIAGALDTASGKYNVVLSGIANVSTPLTQGKYYFATSNGNLVCADDTNDFVLFPRPGQYITSGNVLVSVEALVGVAVSENSILLQ